MLCPNFDFSYFPFDNQNCTIALRGPNRRQSITLIEEKVATKGGFEYVNLNLQYEIEPTEFDISVAIDSTSYVGITLKFKRFFGMVDKPKDDFIVIEDNYSPEIIEAVIV